MTNPVFNGYIRVSTESQVERGYGLPSQMNAIEEYCGNRGFSLREIYRDEGISGAMQAPSDLFKRKGLLHMVEHLNHGDVVVVVNTNRLWRNQEAQVYVEAEIRKTGAEIVSIEEPEYTLYPKTTHDITMRCVGTLLSSVERWSIKEKLAAGRLTKATMGHKPAGRIPYGYRYDSVTKETIIDIAEAKVIRNIFQWHRDGMGYAAIAVKLNQAKARPRSNKDWCRQSVYCIIKNDFYSGVVRYQGQSFCGKHVSISCQT